jgi:hypothetical protein
MRDLLMQGCKRVGYIANKEVPVLHWSKRQDVEVVDSLGHKATKWIEVSIRAFVQENLPSLETIMKTAVRGKRRVCPMRDKAGRHRVVGEFKPFIMSSMGSLDKEAWELLKELRSTHPSAIDRLMDLLVVQHAKWIARRINRSLGFFNASAAARAPDKPKAQYPLSKNSKRGRLVQLHAGLVADALPRGSSAPRKGVQKPVNSGSRGAGAATSRAPKSGARGARGPTTVIVAPVEQPGKRPRGRPPNRPASTAADPSHGPAKPSPAFADESGFELNMAYEEELIADTDAKDDHRALRARSAEGIPVGSKDLVESEFISTLAFSPPPK